MTSVRGLQYAFVDSCIACVSDSLVIASRLFETMDSGIVSPHTTVNLGNTASHSDLFILHLQQAVL